MKRRATPQLGAVYEVLAASHDHPTAQQVFRRVRRTLPRVSLGTVYRNLEKLRDAGRLRVVRLGGGQAHYDAMTAAHDHFICETCGAVVDLPDRAPAVDLKALRAAGYTVHWHTTALYGVCQQCAGSIDGRALHSSEGGESMDLPALVPLFPLPNAVLFPGVPLPLHIFEPRYRDMVRDGERGEARLIGMVLLRGEWRKEYYGSPEIYPVGCAGRMVSVEPLQDGRYNILLHGVREFTVIGEQRGSSYRVGEVRWRTAPEGGVASELRTRIHALMQRFLEDREPTLINRLLNDRSLSDELLINFLCYALDFSPMEKQALLEAPSLTDRGARLCDVVQFALETGARGGGGDKWYH